MTILSMGCTKACSDTQQGWHRDGGSEQSGASSSHTFSQKTLPRSKCSRIRAELAGGGEPLVGPAVHRTRQGDGPLLTPGTTGEPAAGYRWRTATAKSPRLPSWGDHPKHPPSATGPCCRTGAVPEPSCRLRGQHVPRRGGRAAGVQAAGLRAKRLQEDGRKNTEQHVPGTCIGRAHQQPHLALDSTAYSPRHRRGGNAVTGNVTAAPRSSPAKLCGRLRRRG